MNIQAARIAMVLYVENQDPHDLAAIIDSIRKQSQVPHFIRIVLGTSVDPNLRFEPVVVHAIDNLRFFCPNVVVLVGQEDKQRNLIMAYDQLSDKKYDIFVLMDADVAIPQDTLFHLTAPYLWHRHLWSVDGLVHDVRYPADWWVQLWLRWFGARFIFNRWTLPSRVGLISACRKVTFDSDFTAKQTALVKTVHRYPTAEPTLTIYY